MKKIIIIQETLETNFFKIIHPFSIIGDRGFFTVWVIFFTLLLNIYNQITLKVKKIELIGLKTVSQTEIIYNMKLKENDEYDEQIFLDDIKRLSGLGYFSKIDYEKEIRKDGIYLRIIFYENPVITKIVIRYSKYFSQKKLKTFMTISEGQLLNENKVYQTKDNILQAYKKEGFVFAGVDYQIDVTGKEATIIFTIVEGTRVKVKKIEFLGLKDISPKKVKKEMKTKESSLLFSKYLDEKVLKEDMIRINSFLRSLGYLDASSYIKELNFNSSKDKVTIIIGVELGEQYFISDIIFEGFTLFPKEELSKTIKSKKGDVYSIKRIEEVDISKLRELYGNSGYPDISIQHLFKLTDKPRHLILIFRTEEPDKSVVRKINISGNIKTKDKVIRRELLIYPGDVYNYRKIKASLQRLYSTRYFEDIKIENALTAKKGFIDLNVKVKEARTGYIRLRGGFSPASGFLGIIELGLDNFDIGRFPKNLDDLIEGRAFAGGGQTFKLFFAPGTKITQAQLFFREPYLFD
ncbi:MAG: outer membrane protein assembly factor, partial [Planctomycetota bacterium]